MNDKKIIIRNCPNITFIDFWRLDKSKSSYCKIKNCGCENYTDCLLKRIYEKVKECQCGELMNGYFDIEECK